MLLSEPCVLLPACWWGPHVKWSSLTLSICVLLLPPRQDWRPKPAARRIAVATEKLVACRCLPPYRTLGKSTRTHAGYWNCEEQVSALVDELVGEPADALVLIGPVSSGKSRLLSAVLSRLQAQPRPPLVVHIDCRAGDFTSPEAFARALQNKALEAQLGNRRLLRSLVQLLPLVQSVLPLIDLKASAGGLNFSFALQRLLQGAVPMEDMLAIYQRAIDSSEGVAPVFIVVRANADTRPLSGADAARACNAHRTR